MENGVGGDNVSWQWRMGRTAWAHGAAQGIICMHTPSYYNNVSPEWYNDFAYIMQQKWGRSTETELILILAAHEVILLF